MRYNLIIGLLGLIAGLLVAVVAGMADRPAFAQGMAADGMVAVPANFNNQQEDIVWVLDAKSKRMTCYRYKNNMIEFVGARNITYDLQAEEFVYQGKHVKPSDIEKLLKEKNKERKKP